MKTKEIKDFYKKSQYFLRENQSEELIGIPFLSPHLPRSIILENNRIKLNFFVKLFNFVLRFFLSNKNYNYYSKQNYKHLILSHLVSYDNLNYDNDFYFGNLAKKLNHKEVLFVLIDHIGFKKENAKNKIKGNYVILSKKMNLFSEIRLFFETSIKIFYYNFFFSNYNIFSLKNIMSSIDNQRISIQINDILKKNQIENFFFTYEGNPYEKLVCCKVQKNNKKIRKIGYQSGVIRKLQFSLYSSINKIFDPDIIFTVGDYNKKILNTKLKNRFKIYNFGLLRHSENFLKKNKLRYKKKIKILVMPEGIINEIEMFMDFCSKNNNDEIDYTFRLHPIFLKNKSINAKLKKIGGNLIISKGNLEYDIKNNDYLLYRGTSAVTNAINSDLIPIYLHKKNQITLDPLFEVNKKHIIEYDDNLLDFILKDIRKKKFEKEMLKIKKFSKNFYDKPKFSNILKLLKKN